MDLPEYSCNEVVYHEHQKVLGSGTYGVVYLYHRKNYEPDEMPPYLAVKFGVGNPVDDLKTVNTKADLLTKLDHKNVVKVYRMFVDSTQTKPVILIMEYCPGGNLRLPIERGLCWTTMVEYARQITEALVYLKSKLIAHCDLKPENIVLYNLHRKSGIYGGLKIVDIDDHIRLNGEMTGSVDADAHIRATRSYYSPEMSKLVNGETSRVGRRTDVWSLGAIVHEMAFPRRNQLERLGPNDSTGEDDFGQAHFLKCVKQMNVSTLHPPSCDHLNELLEQTFIRDSEHRSYADEILPLSIFKDSAERFLNMSTDALPRFKALSEQCKSKFVWLGEPTYASFWTVKGDDDGNSYASICAAERESYAYTAHGELWVMGDFFNTMKLLHSDKPVWYVFWMKGATLASVGQLMLIADNLVELLFFEVARFDSTVLATVTLPNLRLLALRNCSEVTIGRNDLSKFFKLVIFSIKWSTIKKLEENFLLSLGNLRFFKLSMYDGECDHMPQQPHDFFWLGKYLEEHPELTQVKKEDVPRFQLGERTLFYGEARFRDWQKLLQGCNECIRKGPSERLSTRDLFKHKIAPPNGLRIVESLSKSL